MKLRSRSFLCLLALGSGLSSCRGPLPTEADLERAYKHSQSVAQQDIADLDARRARGEITAAEYVTLKREILDRVTARANDIVLTQTALVQSARQATGLPTPETPQDITVPQAGGLSTGTARRAFNDSGNADGTGAGLGFLPGGTIGVGTFAGYNGVAAAPVVAVAQPVTQQVQQPANVSPSGGVPSRGGATGGTVGTGSGVGAGAGSVGPRSGH